LFPTPRHRRSLTATPPNSADENGGGLAIRLANSGTGTNTATLTSLTVYENQAATAGGGLYENLSGSSAATLLLRNSIIAGDIIENPPEFGPDVLVAGITTSFKSLGYNFIGVGDNGTGIMAYPWTGDDHWGTAANPLVPALDPNGLQWNGGPTETLKLLTTANGGYHMGDPTLAGTTDQRGYTRVSNPPTTDISVGAYDPDATAPA
jgi:hypothetical protein